MGLSQEVGPGGDDGARRPRRLAVALALLALGLSIAPSVAAIHDWTSQRADPWLEHCSPGGWSGYEGGSGLVTYRMCYHYAYDYPTLPFYDIRTLGIVWDVETQDCPTGFDGYILAYDGTRAGACASVEAQAPTNPWAVRFGLDTADCDIPDRPDGGRDPVVLLFDGGVAVCVLPILESDKANVHVSPEPCQPDSVDPEVRVADGGVLVCADFHVFGIGSSEANLLIQEANRTANQTIQAGDNAISLVYALTP